MSVDRGRYGRDYQAFLCSSEYCSHSFDRLDLCLLHLCIASCHIYQCIRILPVQLPDDVAALLVRVLGHCAGVY